MQASEIEALFQGQAGFRFARWGRAAAPVVFGLSDETLPVMKGALELVWRIEGQALAETDPELGANLMLFFFRDWAELRDVPNLDRLIEGLPALVTRLEAEGADQYRQFRFDASGAIRACFAFIRMGGSLAEAGAEELCLTQAVQAALLWGDAAFAARSPLARAGGHVVLRPEIAALLAAAHDPALPAASRDPALALRLSARMARG